jgi:hypothetical protein
MERVTYGNDRSPVASPFDSLAEGAQDIQTQLTKKTHGLGLSFNVYMATRNGRIHTSSAIDTKERSSMTSETRVMVNIVIIPETCCGIKSRLVSTVLKLQMIRI